MGTPTSGRSRQEFENLLGCFVNTLAIRSQCNNGTEALTFNQLLERVRRATLDAFMHEDVPFEKIVDELHLQRDTSHHPIFQVMFILQNMEWVSGDLKQLEGLHTTVIEIPTTTAKFDLTMVTWYEPTTLFLPILLFSKFLIA